MSEQHGSQSWRARKVVIVGAGQVGATFAYALAQSGVADEIALIDLNKDLVEGQVLDLSHGRFFFPSVDIHVGDESDYADAHVVVLTAGASQRPGESRLDLLQRNASIMRSIVGTIVAQDSNAVILVVTNPVDILTYVAWQASGWPRSRVIGSGTVLDSARFRYMLSEHCGIDARNVHAYILGEHGDSQFAAWSMTHLAGINIENYCPACHACGDWHQERKDIERAVRDSAYHIIDYKGATSYAVGLALVRIVNAILRSENSVLTVSTVLDGEYDLHNVSLSLPCVVNQNGVERIMDAPLPPDEEQALQRSARVLQEAISQLE